MYAILYKIYKIFKLIIFIIGMFLSINIAIASEEDGKIYLKNLTKDSIYFCYFITKINKQDEDICDKSKVILLNNGYIFLPKFKTEKHPDSILKISISTRKNENLCSLIIYETISDLYGYKVLKCNENMVKISDPGKSIKTKRTILVQ